MFSYCLFYLIPVCVWWYLVRLCVTTNSRRFTWLFSCSLESLDFLLVLIMSFPCEDISPSIVFSLVWILFTCNLVWMHIYIYSTRKRCMFQEKKPQTCISVMLLSKVDKPTHSKDTGSQTCHLIYSCQLSVNLSVTGPLRNTEELKFLVHSFILRLPWQILTVLWQLWSTLPFPVPATHLIDFCLCFFFFAQDNIPALELTLV